MKAPKKLPEAIVALLLPRLSDEFMAFYTYRSASNWMRGKGFFIAADFFAKESVEELAHAKKIEDYLTDWNVVTDLPKIEEPPVEFESFVAIIEKAYAMEYDLYEEYEDTSKKIFDKGDICTFDFLQFFRAQQTKSVAEYSDMLNVLDGVDMNDKYQLLKLQEILFGE